LICSSSAVPRRFPPAGIRGASWINLPIAGLESACPQDRHGQNVVSIASNTWPASWAARALEVIWNNHWNYFENHAYSIRWMPRPDQRTGYDHNP
jgi:hypothetical protein